MSLLAYTDCNPGFLGPTVGIEESLDVIRHTVRKTPCFDRAKAVALNLALFFDKSPEDRFYWAKRG